MRIPKNTLHTQHIRTYGSSGFTLEGLSEQSGCPSLYKAKYVEYTLKEPRSYALEYGTLIHDALFLMEEEGLPLLPDALEKAWSRLETPLPYSAYEEAVDDFTKYMERGGMELATLAVEQKLTMPLMELDGEEFFFGGTLDWIGIDPNDDTTLYFKDYKTNRYPPRKTDLDNDPQFTGYGALVRANIHKWLPDVDPKTIKIVGIMDAIKWYELPTTREDWQYDNYLDFLRAMVRKIHEDQAGEPVLNDECSWCPIKYDCKEFRKLPGKGETLRDRMSRTTDMTQRVYLMQEANNVIRALKAMTDEVRSEIADHVRNLPEGVTINGVKYAPADDYATDWDVPALQKLLGPDFFNVINVVAGKVDDLASRRPELKEPIERTKKRELKSTKKLTAKKVHDG